MTVKYQNYFTLVVCYPFHTVNTLRLGNMTINIQYLAQDGVKLGRECYEEHSEVLIPDFVEGKHDVYLKKHFKTVTDTVWKVTAIDIKDLVITVSLMPVSSPRSLGETADVRGKSIASLLPSKKYQLVEVEFGFQKHMISRNEGNKGKNQKYTCSLLPGDLYKKRPCIVLNCKRNRVKVIPLTTSSSNNDPWQMKISPESFEGLHERYVAKDSFALLDTVQTVSAFRVFPMRLKNGSFNDSYHKFCLDKPDIEKLEKEIALLNSKEVVDENTRLKLKHTQIMNELKSEKAKRRQKETEFDNLTSELEEVNIIKSNFEDAFYKLADAAGEVYEDRSSLLKKWQNT